MVVLLEGSLISTQELYSSVTSLFSLAGRLARKSLGGSKLLPFNNDGGHCVLGEIVCYPSPDLCLHTILSRSSMDNSFNLMALFLL
jgi:hypothetical protein